jgi:hypothetical protein
MGLRSEFVRKYPDSTVAKQIANFDGEGFSIGKHGSFAVAMWNEDLWHALKFADAENRQLLHDLLFPGYMDEYCESCERIDPDDYDPSDYCNEGWQ